jgi:hypothetical protein
MTADEVMSLHAQLSNWGRWGPDDQLSALDFINADVTAAALSSVQSGRTVSCARPLPTQPAADNPTPVAHHMIGTATEGYGGDYFAMHHTDSRPATSMPFATSSTKAGSTTAIRSRR